MVAVHNTPTAVANVLEALIFRSLTLCVAVGPAKGRILLNAET